MKMKIMPLQAWCLKYQPRACANGAWPVIKVEDDDQVLYAVVKASTNAYGNSPGSETKIGPLPSDVMVVWLPSIKMGRGEGGADLAAMAAGCYIGDIDHMMTLQKALDSIQHNLKSSITEVLHLLTL